MIVPVQRAIDGIESATARHATRAVITQSSQMRQIIAETIRASKSTASILLVGESGTGKELFAKIVHEHSPRCQAKFVSVNCAALPANLIESELFGHEKGSFTDAIQQRLGRFEYAAGGTLFLDEITEMPLTTQAKLLRALESNEIQRIGSNDSIKTNIRVVASTNRDILDYVQKGRFRLDLYHRINVISVHIPPLRERAVDIPLLATHFIEQYQRDSTIQIRGLTQSAMSLLSRYDWPGNVREFRNAIHRACVMTTIPLIDADSFQHLKAATASRQPQLPADWLKMKLDEIEKQVILAALTRFGSKRLAAENLGVTTRTLANKIKLYSQSQSPQSCIVESNAA